MRERPHKHSRFTEHGHHDNQKRPGLAGIHGEAVGVCDSLAELFHRGTTPSEDLSQPGHSRVPPVSAAVLGSGAPSLGDLTEEPFG
eukprot:8108406-Pyramimonas_sp.AAC.1